MNPSEQLLQAAKGGSTREVRKLLSRGALFVKDKFGNTALHEAAWAGNNDITKLLLKAHCFVDSVNGTGFTPLHLASQNGHAKIAKTLLKGKANPSVTNQHGETPLHLVAKYDHAHLVPVFAAARVDLDLRAKDDNTPLHIASKLGNTPTVKALVQYGANPNLTNQKGLLPLDYAEMSVYKDTARLLMPVTTQMRGKRAQTMDSSMARGQSALQEARSRHSTGVKLGFGKTKSPMEVWSRVNQQRDEVAPVQFRRHQTQLSLKPASSASKRYSREFEDLPMFSHGSRTTPNGAPSIEQLLSEVEKEVHGPDYHYIPPPPSDDSEDGASVTYTSIQRATTTKTQRRYTTPASLKPPQLQRKSLSPQTKKKDPMYDNLLPLAKSVLPEKRRAEGGYITVHFPSSSNPQLHEPEVRTSPDGQDQGSVEDHDYEELPPMIDDDFDCYVYMAPSKDKADKRQSSQNNKTPSSSPQKPALKSSLSCSNHRSPKKAVIMDSPVTLDTKFEPNTKLQPRRPILAQASPDSNDSRTRLQKYMEEELDTIRQAFQIRLSQMEKRYQRQLATVQQEATVRTNSPLVQDSAQQKQRTSLQRRASWSGTDTNGTKEAELAPRLPAAALKLDFDSGSEESVNSCASANSSVCSTSLSVSGDQRDAGAAGTRDNTPDPLSPEELQAVSEQLKACKADLMEKMMAEAENKAMQMEQQYRQMRELARQKQHGLPGHLKHVRSNGFSHNINNQPETFV